MRRKNLATVILFYLIKIGTLSMMETFNVLYDENHGGTFNGCLETLHLSLERFIKDLVRLEIPNIVLDEHPFQTTGKLFTYLRGVETNFPVWVDEGNDTKIKKWDYFQRKENIFHRDAARLIDSLIENRNDHIHHANHYSLFYTFKNISVPLGTEYCLVFNPFKTERHTMVIDEDCLFDVSNFQIIIQKQQRDCSMNLCEQYQADLIIEVLTKKEFETENPNEPGFQNNNTHALVLYYGIKKYFVYFNLRIYKILKGCFGEKNRNWKTYYYRFTAESLLKRMLNRELVNVY